MALFKNAYDSHTHSLEILNLLYEYDSFLDNLTVIADMGCGEGHDSKWFASLFTRDDPPEPRNYLVYAIDQNITQIAPDVLAIENIKPMQGNFEERLVPRQVDLMWAHDSFQYAKDPFKCLATWKDTLNENGMLIMAIPQTTYHDRSTKQLVISNHSHQYYSYNLLNLMYMLAISGFDCRDAYFYRKENTPWIYLAVYASEHGPLPGASWHDLVDRKLVNDSVINSINRYGYARLDDVVVTWLDKDFYKITS
jgi:SAM-dependent methyltransferase